MELKQSFFTENQLQNDRLKLINEGVELFKKFKKLGLIKEFSMQNVDSFCSVLKVGRINGELQIVGDYRTLLNMR